MSKNAFLRLAPFIQDYIYRNNWTELRDVQVASCEIIFDTDDNLMLASGTASGKTEAAFLPIITDLYNNPSKSIGVLYVSPLKALINDQFVRLNEMLEYANIPVNRWHGDVGQSKKDKLVINPKGILQITPESLEAMLIKRSGDLKSLFCDLRYVVIDEVHYFMSSDRGIQLRCILERLQKATGSVPRRVGLSATLSDYTSAEEWLNAGTKRKCSTPKIAAGKRNIMLSLQYFPIPDIGDYDPKTFYNKDYQLDSEHYKDSYYNYIYNMTTGKKCILFSNNKSEVEENIAIMKELCKRKGDKNLYFVHHGDISASYRELAERQMKTSEGPVITGATVTLELGVDLGQLERTVQTSNPYSVSSFVQRLGRTGRRGNPSEMVFAFLENNAPKIKPFYYHVNWNLIITIAMIQLYLEERWVEPIAIKKLPYSLVYHQTMSYIASKGEISPQQVAQNILTLAPFKNISQEDYKCLLRYWLDKEHLQMTEKNALTIGLNGERIINNYEFYSVFSSQDTIDVKCKTELVGTLQTFPKIGVKFALAGKTWEVIEISLHSKTIHVKETTGMSKTSWLSMPKLTLETKVLKKMKEILKNGKTYQYLGKEAQKQLDFCRSFFGGKDEIITIDGEENLYIYFPWIGTKALVALNHTLLKNDIYNEIYVHKGGIPVCIIIYSAETKDKLIEILRQIKNIPQDKYTFDIGEEARCEGKYNAYIPKELLKKQFIEDAIDVEEMQRAMDV